MKLNERYRRGLHWVAILATAFTLPLLYVGGSVTTYRVGLAVPDWPTTFEENMFLYDFWNAPFGVRIEHAHRLYGAAVGFATIVLAGCLLVFERRRWMKGLGVLALVAVIVQGVLGGMRVTRGLDDPGGRPRLHGTGVLRPDGRPLRLDGTGLEQRPAAVGRSGSSEAESSLVLALVYVQIVAGRLAAALWDPDGPLDATGSSRRRSGPRPCSWPTGSNADGRRSPRWSCPSRVMGLAATFQVILGLVALRLRVAD